MQNLLPCMCSFIFTWSVSVQFSVLHGNFPGTVLHSALRYFSPHILSFKEGDCIAILCLVLFILQRNTYFEKKHTAQTLTSRFLRVCLVHDSTQLAFITQWCLSIFSHIEISLSSINSMSSLILTSSLIIFKLIEIKWYSNGVWRGNSAMVNISAESALTPRSQRYLHHIYCQQTQPRLFIHELCLSTVGYWLDNISI